jgi:hypothetical protein
MEANGRFAKSKQDLIKSFIPLPNFVPYDDTINRFF